MINVYDKMTMKANFSNNGLVVLHETTSCIITEELNGLYELTLIYPITDTNKFEFLIEENVIKAGDQLFRIYCKTKNLDSVTVNARHIFYDLLDIWAGEETMTKSGADILTTMLADTQGVHEFTAGGNIGGSYTYTVPNVNVVESIMGTEGLIAKVGGEIQRNNFDIQLLNERGLNSGVLISYGKNIQGIEEKLDMDSVGTRLKATGSLENKKIYLPEGYIDSPFIGNYSHPKTRTIDFPMDVIYYIVTPETTVATEVYMGASTATNLSYSTGLTTAALIATISGKEQLTPAEKVTLNNEWQKVHTEYDIYYNRAVAWFDAPVGTYATLEDLKNAYPQGNEYIYEVTNADTANGQKWYYWDSFLWAETGRITTQLTGYTAAYNALKAYTEPILVNMSTTTGAKSTITKAKWKVYLTARNTILTQIWYKTQLSLWKIRSAANMASYIVKLRQTATDYFALSGCDLPQPNYKVDFLELSKTEEYKNYSQLETVNIGDAVIIKHSKLNMLFTLRVIKVTTDIIKNRIDKIELGTIAQSLVSNFNSTASAIAQISARVNNLEKTVARVDVDGIITGGAINTVAYDELYARIEGVDSVTDAFMDQLSDDLAAKGASLRVMGEWNAITAYVNDADFTDVVTTDTGTYYCKVSNTGQLVTDINYWGSFATGMPGLPGTSFRAKGTWNSGTAYVNDAQFIDMVTDSTGSYYCIISNTGQPVTNATYWGSLASNGLQGAQGPIGNTGSTGISYRNLGAWLAGTAYVNNATWIDTVNYNGSLYACKIPNTGTLPTNGTYWTLIVAKGDTGSTGSTGSTGPAGPILDWVQDWDGLKTLIKSDYIVSPKIFSGINGGTAAAPILTGVAMGRDVLGGSDTTIGIVGYNANAITYQLKTDGSAVFGKTVGQQFIINANGTIVAPEIAANKIIGGVLKLGGASNGNGTLSIVNASNKPIVAFDNSNATISLHGTTETFLIQGENTGLAMYDYMRMTAYGGNADENSMWFHADHWFVESGYTEFSTSDTLRITKYLGGGGNLSVDGAMTVGGHRVACNGNYVTNWSGIIATGGYKDVSHNLGYYPITIVSVGSNSGTNVSVRNVDGNTIRIGLTGTSTTVTVEMY